MSSGAFSRRAFKIGAMCRREAIIALKSSKKSPLYPSGRRKIAMLPTCIGISGVSRYRNDASIEDSFLASLIFFPSRYGSRGALVALLALDGPGAQDLRIVHFPEVHMQWQTAPTGQIG